MQKYYITTTLPYVNADPHIGFALEIIQADVIARYQRLLGKEVIFNTGTDEHGLKIWRKAEEAGITAQEYCNEYAARFGALKDALNLSYTHFIRTTDSNHKNAAQEFWRRCNDNGFIYKKDYQVKYCVGCELEKTDSELVDEHCPIHPKMEIELIDEENYFFKFSAFQQPLLELYEKNSNFVIPANRQEEIKKFVERGLEDFSISRLKAKMPWGVPVPGDDEQVMYVWFDALVNYISTLGWSTTNSDFENFWPGTQVAGKDNLRQQSAMWQAMLLAAKLPTSKQIFIHGFITAEGQKMSKSLGNVVNPMDLVTEFGTDPVRYYLLGALPAYDDGDFSLARFREYYTAHLANGVGNLTARIATLAEKYTTGKITEHGADIFATKDFWKKYDQALNQYKFDDVIRHTNELVSEIDGYISETKVWEAAKTGADVTKEVSIMIEGLYHLAVALVPILPQTATKILTQFGQDVSTVQIPVWGEIPESAILHKAEALFPRLPAESIN